MKSFKNASVSANDAGGSRGASGTEGVCTPADCGTLPWRCAFTIHPGSNVVPPSSVEGVRGLDISMGDRMESFLPEVEDCVIFDARTTPRLAFVGRVLPGLRFGASKRLILGSRSQVGFRTAFGGEPVGLEGGSFFGPEEGTPKEVCIESLGGSCAAGWAGRIGAGEEGAENRDDGESSWVWLVALCVGVVGVAGYSGLSNNQLAKKDDSRPQ